MTLMMKNTRVAGPGSPATPTFPVVLPEWVTPTPSNFGDPLDGGYYAGMIWNQIAQSTTSSTKSTGTKTFQLTNGITAGGVYVGQSLELRSRSTPANKVAGTVLSYTSGDITVDVTSTAGAWIMSSDWSIMSRFRVIVAPKSGGENPGVLMKNANTASPNNTLTLTEGWDSTVAMRSAGTSSEYPAAHWVRGLVIAGRSDWYIPSRDELELCWRNLKPVTNSNYVSSRNDSATSYATLGSYDDVSATQGINLNSSPTGAAYTAGNPDRTTSSLFRMGGTEAYEFGSSYYWSSSDYSVAQTWMQTWATGSPGYQSSASKATSYRVRAVRRSVI